MNEEFDLEAFGEEEFFPETEYQSELPRRRRPTSRRSNQRQRIGAFGSGIFRRPVRKPRRRPSVRFPFRFPSHPANLSSIWPGLRGAFPVSPVTPPDPRTPPRNASSGASVYPGASPSPPMGDEPDTGSFDPDMPPDTSASVTGTDSVEGDPSSAQVGDQNGQSQSANDSSEFYLEFASDAPSSSSPTTFRLQAVENPGGGRIKNKTPPNRSEVVNVRGVGRGQVPLHRLAATALEALINAARADGLAEPLLRPVSGFRDPARQAQLWQRALARYGSPQEARKWVAPPGGSAHQTGRAIDFYLGGQNSSGRVAQLRTLPAYHWLVRNARRFGFYPYEREPWHWEYNPPAAMSQEFSQALSPEWFESDREEMEAMLAGEALEGWHGEAVGGRDPSLAAIAERIAARRPVRASAMEFEQERPARSWTSCFKVVDVERVRKTYQDNTQAARANRDDSCSCIVMLNVALGQLLKLKTRQARARSKSSRMVQMGALTTETIEKAMAQLRRAGFARPAITINFFDRRNKTAGTLKPERLKSSVQKAVLDRSTVKGCWYAYGLSIMDGYHSVLLLVDKTGNGGKIYWLDQNKSDINDDVTTTLDQHITTMTRDYWQAVKDEKQIGSDTMVRIWPLRQLTSP